MLTIIFILMLFILFYWIPLTRYRKTEYYSQTHHSFFSVSFDKGTGGEFSVWRSLDRLKGYKKCLFNCYLPKDNGETTEADLILLHESGIYVLESKNYGGWIFGSEKQKYWTQTLPDKHGRTQKNQFFNPVIQNEVHIRWLARYLDIDPERICSYIVFSDRCTLHDISLSSPQHHIVNQRDLVSSINFSVRRLGDCMSRQEIDSLYEKLYPLTQSTRAERRAHIEEVRKKEEPAPTPILPFHTQPRCPRCGGSLVLRTAHKGPNEGKQFWGCSNFPRCRYTKNVK